VRSARNRALASVRRRRWPAAVPRGDGRGRGRGL